MKNKLKGQEKVLVIKRTILCQLVNLKHNFTVINDEEVLSSIIRYSFFIPRIKAEYDINYKQLIPYSLIRFNHQYLLLRRTTAQSEVRLHNKYSLGVGGHINQSEIKSENIIIDGLLRELNEELCLPSKYDINFIGFINDEETEVGQVHLGLLFETKIQSPKLSIRENDKMVGSFACVQEIKKKYNLLESWSKIVLDNTNIFR